MRYIYALLFAGIIFFSWHAKAYAIEASEREQFFSWIDNASGQELVDMAGPLILPQASEEEKLRGRMLLILAAAKGSVNAEFLLGICNLNGVGEASDYVRAREWFEKAYAHGDGEASYELGIIWKYGLGVQPDYQKAVRYFEYGAQRKISSAMNELAKMYATGEGVSQNYRRAAALLEESSTLGNAYGKVQLGDLYYEGLGLQRNFEEARKLYREAAEKNNGEAQYKYSYMIMAGEGGPADRAEALVNLALSCKNNYQAACETLQRLESGQP